MATSDFNYLPNHSGTCPHCGRDVYFAKTPEQESKNVLSFSGSKETVTIGVSACPHCGEPVIEIIATRGRKGVRWPHQNPSISENFVPALPPDINSGSGLTLPSNPTPPIPTRKFNYLAWPLLATRPVAEEVPEDIADLYREAVAVLNISPRASAALSRLALESLLIELDSRTAKTGKTRLHDLVKELSTKNVLSPEVVRLVNYVKEVGNFGVHTRVSSTTNEVFDATPEEAETNLTVLDRLFDIFYVQPARDKEAFDKINQKLTDSGHKEI